MRVPFRHFPGPGEPDCWLPACGLKTDSRLDGNSTEPADKAVSLPPLALPCILASDGDRL
jgi:hypothetical protein